MQRARGSTAGSSGGTRDPTTMSFEEQWCTTVAKSLLRAKFDNLEVEDTTPKMKWPIRPKPKMPPVANLNPFVHGQVHVKEGFFMATGRLTRLGYSSKASKNWRNVTIEHKQALQRAAAPARAPTPRQKPANPRRRKPKGRPPPRTSMDGLLHGQECDTHQRAAPAFRWKSKLPPIYKEIKTVMQPSLPTTGNDDKFAEIPQLVKDLQEMVVWEQAQIDAAQHGIVDGGGEEQA